MKSIKSLPLFIGMAGTLLLPLLYYFDMISLGNLISNEIVAISLFAAGTSMVLLYNTSGLVKYLGLGFSWMGFLLIFAAAYKWIELRTCWKIALGLLGLSLIMGIVHGVSNFQKTSLFWIVAMLGVSFSIALTLVLLGNVNQLIFNAGFVFLTFFSLVSFVASMLKSNS